VTEGGHRASTEDDQRLFGQLAKLWQSHRRRDLETRHRTGVLLNERLGPPDEAQAYGPGILKRVGEKCRISQSEISRMRWFAHLFDTLDRFRQKHPEVSSWTEVKALLPDLNPRKGDESRGQTVAPSRTATGGVTRSLTSLINKLKGMDPVPEGREDEVLREKLRELIEVANNYLANRSPSPALETDSSPGRPAGRMPTVDDLGKTHRSSVAFTLGWKAGRPGDYSGTRAPARNA